LILIPEHLHIAVLFVFYLCFFSLKIGFEISVGTEEMLKKN